MLDYSIVSYSIVQLTAAQRLRRRRAPRVDRRVLGRAHFAK